MDNLSGRIVKSYKITDQLNRGGFGAVYRAYQPVIEREVALKVILPRFANEPEFIRRFEVEAQTVAQLEHPYIVPMYDYWRDPDGAYLVMRLMRGGNLRDIIHRGAIPAEQVLTYIDQISAALSLAHRQNIIHRDIKPENMLLDEEGNAFLTDFGIAQRHDLEVDTDDIDSFAGSVSYIAPELIRGERPYVTADIYSLGILTFELLTGELPFQAEVAPAILNHHLNTNFPDATVTIPHLPPDIDFVLQRACTKDPADRYQSVREFAHALREVISGNSGITIDMRSTEEVFKIVDNPYKGLRPFNEADAQDFFGREELVQTLVNRLNEDEIAANFLAVVGPSGSGKSSVVRAGLIPRMRYGDVADTFNWFIADMVPGDDPLGNLANALLGLAPNPLPDLFKRLHDDETAIVWAGQQILQGSHDGHFLLFIDQFEEVFTLTTDESVRTHLLQMLNYTVKHAANIYVVVTIRADFFDKPLFYDGIGDLIQSRTQVVLPLSAREIERAIVGPADNANLIVDGDLVAAIVADVRQEPGALPLLQYTLTELFERRETNRLTLNTYIDSGGVLSSLARRAQDVFNDLSLADRQLARQIFLRLVTLGEGTEDTRRRARRAELLAISPDRENISHILDIFGKYRLLTFDRDPSTRQPTVEIAHEALIKRWDDLQNWLDESRNDVRLQRSLAVAAQEWRDNQQKQGFLLYGARLLQYEDWVAETTVAITQQERQYLDASIAEKERREELERERKEREAMLQQRVLNRTRFLAIVMAIASVITIGLAVIAVIQQRAALEQQEIAVQARGTSDANALNAEQRAAENQNLNRVNVAARSVENGDSGLAVALLQSVANSPNLSPAIEGEFYPAAYSTQLRNRLGGHTDKVTAIATNATGTRIATGSEDLRILVWNAATLEIEYELMGHRGLISDLAFSPDGTQLVSVGNDALVVLWDLARGTPIREMRGHRNVITGVDFSPSGAQIATSSGDNTLIIWDVATGNIIQQLEGHEESVRAVAYSPDGTSIVSAGREGDLILWDVATGSEIMRFRGHDGSVLSVDYSATGTRIVSSSFDRSLIIWDARSGEPLSRLIGHSDEVTSVSFSPDDQLIVSTSCAARDNERTCVRGEVLLWDAREGREIQELTGHTEIVNASVFTPDSRRIITGSCSIRREGSCIAGEAFIWDVAQTSDAFQILDEHRSSVFSVAYDHANNRALTGGGSLLLDDQPQGDTSIILWDTITGNIIERFEEHTGNITDLVFHPTTNTFLSASRDATIRVWSLEANEQIEIFTDHTASISDIALSSDGAQVLSAGDNRVLYWNYRTRQVNLEFSNLGSQISARSVAISPDKTILAAGLNNGVIIFWDATSGDEIRRLTGHTDDVIDLDFSADGQFLVSGSNDQTVRLWRVSDGTQYQSYTGHEAPVTDVILTPDGRHVLTASEDQTMRYWDLESGELIHIFTGHTGQIFDISLSQDGNIAYTASADGTAIGWRISLQAVVEWLQDNRYQRAFTPDERELYQIPEPEE